ncbi:MAG: TetR/AcrR family transcriptional regulator [Clostridiales bacterium]|nr:TetR/AcrR family transcriptional regulator [Clostridiales bacterium]
MPKDTFNNLSEEKKQRIFDAAVREFSTRRFSEASLNQIIKNAKIPWGSFYQYFNNKEDIFLFMYEEIYKEKLEILSRQNDINQDDDLLKLCEKVTKATYEWARKKPEYCKISILIETDNSKFITQLRDSSLEVFKILIKRDIERGIIKKTVDPDLIADFIYTLIWKQFMRTGNNEKLFFQKINDGLNIIKDGIISINKS